MKRSSLSAVIFMRRNSGKLKGSGKEGVTRVTSPADRQLSGSDRHMSVQSVCRTYGPYNTCDRMSAVALKEELPKGTFYSSPCFSPDAVRFTSSSAEFLQHLYSPTAPAAPFLLFIPPTPLYLPTRPA